MRQFRTYVGKDSGQVTCINDAFGVSVAVFNDFYSPGDIAKRQVAPKQNQEELTPSRFRVLREVSAEEVEKLLVLAECSVPARDGWWYEVIGD